MYISEEDEDDGGEITASADVEIAPTFEALGLKEDLLRGIYAYGNILSTYIC